MSNVKMCRLITGETLVGDWEVEPKLNDEEHIATGSAICTLQFQDPSGQGKMALVPWIPGASLKEPVNIPSKMVMAIGSPDDQMANVYNQQFGSGIQLARTMPAGMQGDPSQIIK